MGDRGSSSGKGARVHNERRLGMGREGLRFSSSLPSPACSEADGTRVRLCGAAAVFRDGVISWEKRCLYDFSC